MDLQRERKERKGIHLLSRRLEALITSNHVAGGQAVLLLNRRGYANYIACPDHRCGWMMRCHHCDVTMVYHREKRLPSGGVVRCHHCQAEQLLERVCPESGHTTTVFGLGTQRVEEEIARKFPSLSLARMDADTMRSAADYRRVLDAFGSGETDLLLGHADDRQGAGRGERAAGGRGERRHRAEPAGLPSQRTHLSADRAGGGSRGPRATPRAGGGADFSPDDPAIGRAAAHDFEGFAADELVGREAVGLPPAGRMARIVLRDLDPVALQSRAVKWPVGCGRRCRIQASTCGYAGPPACAISRIADHHRMQIELMADGAAPIQRVLTTLRNAGELISDTHTAVDVDPISLL